MKNALILHGTGDHSQKNWFQWLATELEKKGYRTWVPDLPSADRPNASTYTQFLLGNEEWEFDQDSILIGHSSGAVEVLYLLQNLPAGVKVDSCFLIGVFDDPLGASYLEELFLEPLDFELIRSRARRFVVIHSDNDPYVPLAQAQRVADELKAEVFIKPGEKHFSIGTGGSHYSQFPFLLEQILPAHLEKLNG